MKYLKYFLLGGIFLLGSSYTTRTSEISEGISPGNLIPNLKIENNLGQKIDLHQLKGVKVLVNFWAAYDAESRMRNIQLWNTLKGENEQIVLISVSFDESKSVFEKTLLVDGIDSEYQFLDTKGSESEIYKRHRLEKGFRNYLIDENGVIIAKDVTVENLKTLL
ncbi:thioredoxin-like domain-containing protein [Dysgonomonas sp. 520]|uniref:TlpA family protein disulfide reductase n=1 Tax=Dysgonomonas sp. 520 TaxID=2302931 RepID=UPI0013D413C9|nr:thioredoxin-like domain-containing protein [Dysgonomonas sp. 520]NDW09108.1 TlpA family protein disulfide reductase [Dysgonomonas sp. 520]